MTASRVSRSKYLLVTAIVLLVTMLSATDPTEDLSEAEMGRILFFDKRFS